MAIILSMKPKMVDKILNGEKTIEIRKTRPKCELPCKVYIYCTKAKPYLYRINDDDEFETTNKRRFPESCYIKDYYAQNKEIVAEFVLEKIDKLEYRHLSVSHQNAYIPISKDADYQWEKHSCLNYSDIVKYGKFVSLYAWHISDLKIYNKARELSEFKSWQKDKSGWQCVEKEDRLLTLQSIKQPPKSWCYCEEANDDN